MPRSLIVSRGLRALSLALLVAGSAAAHADRPCPFELETCTAGTTGGGGCYSPVRERCVDGAVVADGAELCRKGPYGPGGGFFPKTQSCYQGVVVPEGMAFCPGEHGKGWLYAPYAHTCQGGKLIVRPSPAPHPNQRPQSVPLGDLVACPPGAKGPGGRYVPGFVSCDQGLIH